MPLSECGPGCAALLARYVPVISDPSLNREMTERLFTGVGAIAVAMD